ncbi:MAG TPA: bifunctional DNA-binding transcriptional regulator/O6-methylguanine-DNA methyltransferase Ada [Blastocatellia bacterium]|nr:bifunctional DNA-binding transcriptional regulator/O6-methylguanine-DNA methyltransferase Ada [Blastocatellia bacterium]
MNESREVLSEIRKMDEETRWEAVRTRDARFNSIFVYGVRSTGIYCRPSCPSRRPRREHVTFLDSCEEAERSGFRACRRCNPREAGAAVPAMEMVLRACRAIEDHVRRGEGTISLSVLSEALKVSPHHLHRTFKSVTGVTPRQYAAAHRLEQFKSMVRRGDELAGAMYGAGFGSSSRLYEKGAEQLGMTPATYRQGGKGMVIDYAIVDSPLGRLLVAATGRGVCAVSFGDEDERLESALAAEYPAATIRRDGKDLGDRLNALLRHLDGAQARLDLPLDLQATAFQSRVWEEMRKIPYGATRSYKELAEAIGRPSAARAVARACASNPVALINPCHRIIREDGTPGGYRWGLERKSLLLSREKERRDTPAPSTPDSPGDRL